MNLIDRLIACERMGGVMLLGLDDFSRINLLNGHAFGNTVLSNVRPVHPTPHPRGRVLFRLDGDVFAIVMDAPAAPPWKSSTTPSTWLRTANTPSTT